MKAQQFHENKFRLKMFKREMESKSGVVRTKTGERLNLIKFQIIFSVAPSFLFIV